ncbi:MAG: hypothetical protein Q4B91_03105 [Atopobiaceae bacterium]|nr:hypothetical protein [Atopobiaceae bacterium]
MRYSKRVVATMPKAYAVAAFDGQDARSFVVGVEKDGPIRRFALDGTPLETVAEGPGGVMTIAQVPGRADQLLATSEFFSPNFGADTAGIVCHTRAADGSWSAHRICELPYVHRFGVLTGADGQPWLIACTIKGSCRRVKDDWSAPGAVYVARLGAHLEAETVELTELAGCQLQNHGFWTNPAGTFALVSTAAGVFRYDPPATADGAWSVRCLIVQPTSDVCMADFDGDGTDEILTLSAFHGDTLRVWHETEIEGVYASVWEDPEKRDFLHAVWSGEICGEPCAVIGNRRGGRDLLRVHYADGAYRLEAIDHDRGPANCWVLTDGDVTRIVAANRETDEVALYDVMK